MPVYNNQDGLEKTLQSLESETEPMDIYVIDDGSQLAMKVPENCPLSIHLFRMEDNMGIRQALNLGLQKLQTKDAINGYPAWMLETYY